MRVQTLFHKILPGKMAERLFFLLMCATVFHAVSAAEITRENAATELDIYYLSGDITDGDGKRFRALLDRTRVPGRPGLLILDSNGGSVMEAYELAQMIISGHLGTFVPGKAACYSACFVLLAAGQPRGALATSKIGVHRIAIHDAENTSSKGFSVDMNEVYRALDVPPKIRLAMLETPSRDMYLLTPSDIREFSSIPDNVLDELAEVRIPEQKVSARTFDSLGALLTSYGELIKSADDGRVVSEIAETYIPEALKLVGPELSDGRKEYLLTGIREFTAQANLVKGILASAAVSDTYSDNKTSRELLESLFLEILTLNPRDGTLLRHLADTGFQFDRDRDIQNLAFADRYNELRELCRAGFCSEEQVKEQERAWIRRSEAFNKIMEGRSDREFFNRFMINNQISFINTLKFTVASRIRDRTYITKFDFSSYTALMNSIIDVYNRMARSELTRRDIDQYNAVMGAYILPYIENALTDEGNDYSEITDLSLTGGAYDLAYREFYVSSNRLFFGESYPREATEYVKLEGKIIRAANLMMLLLKKDVAYTRYPPAFHKCADSVCRKEDDRRIFEGLMSYYQSLDSLCQKGKCHRKQFQRQKNSYTLYSKIYDSFISRHSYVHREHLTASYLSWQLGRMQRDHDQYSK